MNSGCHRGIPPTSSGISVRSDGYGNLGPCGTSAVVLLWISMRIGRMCLLSSFLAAIDDVVDRIDPSCSGLRTGVL